MDQVLITITASGALVFSIALALLLEELIFGGLFRLFFGQRPPLGAPAKAKAAPDDLVARARDSGL